MRLSRRHGPELPVSFCKLVQKVKGGWGGIHINYSKVDNTGVAVNRHVKCGTRTQPPLGRMSSETWLKLLPTRGPTRDGSQRGRQRRKRDGGAWSAGTASWPLNPVWRSTSWNECQGPHCTHCSDDWDVSLLDRPIKWQSTGIIPPRPVRDLGRLLHASMYGYPPFLFSFSRGWIGKARDPVASISRHGPWTPRGLRFCPSRLWRSRQRVYGF
ncbi:hypothetical protein LX36DRAFT_13361 [Colletotrichum falcatum]|nr:hypothetical protein LX36DRAFT_13361 [Colletotrichum falcatum]